MKDCYKCGLPSSCLSFRSRCVNCEYESNLFNEKENDKLQAELAQWKKTAQEWRRVARLALEVKS